MKKTIIGLAALGGVGVGGYYVYKNQSLLKEKVGIKNNNQNQSQQQQESQQEQIKRSKHNKNNNNQNHTTPQPKEDQQQDILIPIHDTVNNELISEYLLLLKENMFECFQEIYYFKQEISSQVKSVPIETLKYTLQQELQVEELKFFFDKLGYTVSAVIDIPKSKLGFIRNKIFLQRSHRNTIKQLQITERGEKDLQQKLSDNQDQEIQNQILEIVKELDSVLSGGTPNNTIQQNDIPQEIQASNYIQLQIQLKKAQCRQIQLEFKDHPDMVGLGGNIQLNSFTVQKILYNIDFSETLKRVFKQNNIKLNKYVFIPKLLDFLSEQFSKQDQQLSAKIKKLDRIYEFAFEACIYEHEKQGVIDEIFDRL